MPGQRPTPTDWAKAARAFRARIQAEKVAEGTRVDPEAFARFVGDLHARLEAGSAAYGDSSFDRPTGELLDELRQEALDLAGWGYVLATRIERLQRRAEGQE